MNFSALRQKDKTTKNFVLALFLALAFLFSQQAFTAHAAENPETTNEYIFSGNVQNDGKAIPGVKISVTGNGFSESATTDNSGRWQIAVPKKATYSVTLDEETLPKGIIVAKGANTAKATFGLSKMRSVNFFLGKGERATTNLFDQFLDRLVNGLNFGLLLALASIGLSLIFGTTGLSNFAHSEMITFGALATYSLTFFAHLPLWLAIAGALLLSATFGWTLDATLWKPLRKRGVGLVQLMIVSIGLSLSIRYIFQYFFGGSTVQLPGSSVIDFRFGPISVSWVDFVSMGVSIVVLLAVAFFLLKTRIGKATRAVSDNASLASASGIDVDRVIRIVWVLGGALAGLSGILWAYFRPGVSWDMGFEILLLVFAAVTLGGLGTAFGALIGSLVIGIFVEVSTMWLTSDLKYVGALVILILVLLVKPQGILGRKERIG